MSCSMKLPADTMRWHGRALACLALAALLGPNPLRAQGLATAPVGTGDASAATVDPTAVHFNPAMTAYANDGGHIFLGGNLVFGRIRYQREYRGTYQRSDSLDFALPVDPSAIDQGRTGRAEAVEARPIALAPSAFVTLPLGDSGLVAGFGAYAPYAAVIDFDDDGPQRFQLQQATIATVFFTPTLAYRFHDAFTLGAGVSYVLGFAELSRVQDFATVDDVAQALANPPIAQANDFGPNAPVGVRELDVMARRIVLRRGFAHAITFNVGIGSEPVEGLRLGLTYQHSAPMDFRGRFELDMDDDFFTQDLASQGLAYQPRVRGDAVLSFPLPRSLRFAASYDVSEQVGLGVDVAYTFWSMVEDFKVTLRSPDLAQPAVGIPDTTTVRLPRRWRNTLGLDGILRWAPRPDLRFWLRGGYRQAASPDSTIDAASPDGDRLVGGLGGAYRVSGNVSLLVDLGVQHVLERHVVGSDFDLANGTYNMTLVHGGLSLLVDLSPR